MYSLLMNLLYKVKNVQRMFIHSLHIFLYTFIYIYFYTSADPPRK